ncbi:hypothetical protein PG996_002667 [Apiospora saccharicola]|uniref:Fungal N-terminal domain-containing protein n=1 Tax=Apiospora saccharicola TaxID=335842 RepID=A0ABR1WN56_9PEZI
MSPALRSCAYDFGSGVMAAESVGLAASIAGLVSLGLQITGGIANYLDALESREEELASVRRQNDALAAALDTIKAATSHNSVHGQQHDSAIEKNIQCCKAELQAVEELLAALADCNTTTWRQRLKNERRKLTYSFNRPKVQRIVQRLQNANGILQLTLCGLGLESLAAIEAGSRNHASELLLLRSEVTTALTPVYEIRDQMPHFERKLDSTADLILSHSAGTSAQMRESDRAAQEDFRRSHDLLQLTMERQLEKLQVIERLQRETLLASRAASRPAALRQLCDSITGANQAPRQHRLLNGPYRQSKQLSSNATRISPFDSIGRGWVIFFCRSSQKPKAIGQLVPLSNTANKSWRSIGIKYTGFASILQAAVDFSFTMTSGAGGFSISPNLTYYTTVTVNHQTDPAFRTLGLLRDCTLFCNGSIDHFAIACFSKLVRLFDDKKACPAAVTLGNRSLLHSVAAALEWEVQRDDRGPRDMSVFSQLVNMLHGFGVPEFTYNSLSATDLLVLGNYDGERTREAINILLQAKLENQPPVLKTSNTISRSKGGDHWHITFGILDLYEICPGYAEACNCGFLSMAVIRNDTEEVVRTLSHYPDSVFEVDIHGNTVLHLAGAKPQVLPILLKAVDLSLLDKRNKYGNTALTVAMHYTGRQCIYGASSERCRRCGCTQCVEILLKAGCTTRTSSSDKGHDIRDHEFAELFHPASELARRRYVVHMSAERISRMRLRSTSQCLSKSDRPISKCINMRQAYCQLRRSQPLHFDTEEVESDDDWIFRQIEETGVADLFYRYGFRPSPSFFCHIRYYHYCSKPDDFYFRWLVEHGADLFFRSPMQPPNVHRDSEIGLYAAHFAGFVFREEILINSGSDPSGELGATLVQKNLKDGCECQCSNGHCDPFIWMMKRMTQRRMEGEWHIDSTRSSMESLYTRCGIELTLLTYKASIRFATFEALELTHTCCDPASVMLALDGDLTAQDRDPWLERDDIVVVNQEQHDLLKLHGQLVEELTEAALGFIKTDSGDRSLFPDFWGQYWIPRMEEELDKISGSSLTEDERRGAEEIGVRWCEPAVETVKENPYDEESLEHWFYELDMVCPEYKEPWPEGLCRVKELS